MPQQTAQHGWSAYTDSQALKELAGLRAVTPSVRFLEKLPTSSTKQKMYHVRQDELIYLSGVEMFQDGTDCVTITKIESDGTEIEVVSGGTSISTFLNLKKKIHNVSVHEYPAFEDFWVEPYLVDNPSKQIVKSNFFRAFKFLDEGYYRITLDERLNPLTGSTGFVANYLSSHYQQPASPNFYVRSKINNLVTDTYTPDGSGNTLTTWVGYPNTAQYTTLSDSTPAPIQAIRTEGELKREIIIRVISKNKDIVTGNAIIRRIINAIPGKSNLSWNTVTNGNPNASIVVGGAVPPSPIHYKGNGTFFIQNERWEIDTVIQSETEIQKGFYNYSGLGYNMFFHTAAVTNGQLEDLYIDPNMELLPISRKIYVGGKINNGLLTTGTNYGSSTPFNILTDSDNSIVTDELRKIKIINLRNSIIENITFIGGDDGIDCPIKPFSYSYNQDFTNTNPITGQHLVRSATIDLSGSVIKNCTFIGQGGFSSMSFENGQYTYNTRFILDGCVFENCKFISTPILMGQRYVGILYKNCTFENKSRNDSASNNGIYEGDAICYMSCNWNTLGRFMFLEDQGMVANTTIIRCHEKCRGMFGNAGEGIIGDQYQPPQGDKEGHKSGIDTEYWMIRLNLFLMNETSFSPTPLVLASFYAKSNFNLSAFNTSYKTTGGAKLQAKNQTGESFSPTVGSLDLQNNWTPLGQSYSIGNISRTNNVAKGNNYNVYMHNEDNFTGNNFVDLQNNCNWNRFLNCTWKNGLTGGNYSFGSYPAVPFTASGGTYVFTVPSSPTNSITNPVYNLINNCAIVGYNDQNFRPNLPYDANGQLENGHGTGVYSLKEEFAYLKNTDNQMNIFQKIHGFKYKDQGISASVIASITGTVMTVVAVSQGTIGLNPIIAAGNILKDTRITSFGTGTGGVGTYNINKSQTVSQQTINILIDYPFTNLTTNPYGMHPNGETDAQLKTRLDNEENVLHNLTKISLRDT